MILTSLFPPPHLSLLLLSAACSSIVQPVTADLPPFPPSSADSYDNGTYGRVPLEHFHTTSTSSYRLLRRTWDEERCGGSDDKIFLAIRGQRLANTGPVIYDNDGHMVWHAEEEEDKFRTKTTYNFRPQWYRGEQYLTWWSGVDEGGHGSGSYYMYDKHYQLYHRVSPIGNYTGDLHEFVITPQNTALLTIYDRIPTDLSAYNIHVEEESYIYDCLFQEIDLETNELLFEWRASDHFKLDDCFYPPRANTSSTRPVPIPINPISNSSSSRPPLRKPRAWDYFHLNSVSKDRLGNYLISSRYSHSLAYISHVTGEILWQLGGKHNNFIDISPPPYTNLSISLAWQHHATILPPSPTNHNIEEDTMTVIVFNNAAVNWNKTVPATALKILLNTTANPPTSRVLTAAVHPQGYIVPSQGSVQQLANGNLFVGYGYAAAMTEFSADGEEVVCDWQYGALHAKPDGSDSAGIVQSYRAFKEEWRGRPVTVPKVVVGAVDVEGRDVEKRQAHAWTGGEEQVEKETRMWISWNGATEVKTWIAERRNVSVTAVTEEDEHASAFEDFATDILETRDSNSSSVSSIEDIHLGESGWMLVNSTPKAGFESSITISIFPGLDETEKRDKELQWQIYKNNTEYRLRALDSDDELLGLWHVSHENVVTALAYKQDEEDATLGRLSLSFGHNGEGHSLRYVAAWILALAICLLLVWMWHRQSSRPKINYGDEGADGMRLLEDLD